MLCFLLAKNKDAATCFLRTFYQVKGSKKQAKVGTSKKESNTIGAFCIAKPLSNILVDTLTFCLQNVRVSTKM
jgi:hypothetical protein